MPDLEPCDMEGLAKECLEAFKRSHAQRPVLVEIDPDMAPVPAQPTSLERVIENLLSNADKYSPAGEPLTLKVTQAAGEMLVSVSDHGKGVPEDELDLIFDSFYRSQGASSVATGHGLGLSISKRIVEAHAGRIWAKNLPGGFEVGFSLPLDDSNIDGESAAEPAVNGTENGHSNGHVASAVENDAGREDLTHAG
jgi:signal transduction histidine kinase